MTTSHPGKIPPELRFSLGRWLAPAQLFGTSGLAFPLPTAIQTQQPLAVPGLRPIFHSPATQQQFNRGSALLVRPNNQVPVSATERMRTAETTGNAESTPIRVSVRRTTHGAVDTAVCDLQLYD